MRVSFSYAAMAASCYASAIHASPSEPAAGRCQDVLDGSNVLSWDGLCESGKFVGFGKIKFSGGGERYLTFDGVGVKNGIEILGGTPSNPTSFAMWKNGRLDGVFKAALGGIDYTGFMSDGEKKGYGETYIPDGSGSLRRLCSRTVLTLTR